MRTIALFLLGILLAPSSSLAKSTYGCPQFQAPEITVNILKRTVETDHTNDLAGIRHIAQSNKKDIAMSEGETPVGLASAALEFRSKYRAMTISQPKDPMVCTQITNVTVDFGFEEATIYMPTELKRHTCGYQTVYRHELKHIKMDYAFVKYVKPRLERDIQNLLRKIGVIRSGTRKISQKKASDAFSKGFTKLQSKYAKLRASWQKRVDTPHEYRTLSRSCDGRLNETVQKAIRLWK